MEKTDVDDVVESIFFGFDLDIETVFKCVAELLTKDFNSCGGKFFGDVLNSFFEKINIELSNYRYNNIFDDDDKRLANAFGLYTMNEAICLLQEEDLRERAINNLVSALNNTETKYIMRYIFNYNLCFPTEVKPGKSVNDVLMPYWYRSYIFVFSLLSPEKRESIMNYVPNESDKKDFKIFKNMVQKVGKHLKGQFNVLLADCEKVGMSIEKMCIGVAKPLGEGIAKSTDEIFKSNFSNITNRNGKQESKSTCQIF